MPQEREIARVDIRDWSGLVTHSDRQDVAPGAGWLQVNMQSDVPGLLRVRRGLTLVQFDARGLVEVLDIVSVQESVTALLVFVFRTTEDAVTVSDSVNAAKGFNGLATDTVTVGETVAASFFITANLADAVTISESVSLLLSKFASVSDTVTVTDVVNPGDTAWVGSPSQKLYLQSGQFDSTVKTSRSVSSVDISPSGISWDGTNTPWSGGNDSKLYLQSGQFASTLKTSRSVSSPTGISWDGTNTPWVRLSVEKKLYLQSGQFASTLKTSLDVSASDTQPNGISWDGTNTPWAGTTGRKLVLQSGQFSSTVKTSLVPFANYNVYDISWNGANTPWVGETNASVSKLFMQSGHFSSTVKTSRSIEGSDSFAVGIESTNVSSRLGV